MGGSSYDPEPSRYEKAYLILKNRVCVFFSEYPLEQTDK